MKDCTATALDSAPLDPRKLPNYVFGMVLGPSDFRQVLENFSWHDRGANRLLHGSGTVCGLKVSATGVPGGTDAEIGISAGFAISPRGRLVRVEPDQCAQLNQWLQAHKNDPGASLAPGAHTVYVTLCYDQCLTDLVPIAGSQCAPDEDNRAPSRILESFKLQFSWTPPPQPVEDRVRAFGDLLRRILVFDADSKLAPTDTSQSLLDAIGALAQDPLKPPADSLPFHLSGKTADATLRQALNIWITEVCPLLTPKAEQPPAQDDCILVAAINFTIAANGNLSLAFDSLGQLLPGTIGIDEQQRPLLMPTRLLQELLLGAAGRMRREGIVNLAPIAPAKWGKSATLVALLPNDLPAEACIELSILSADPDPLANQPFGNVALTLYRFAGKASVVMATNLTAGNLNEVNVRWCAY